MTISVLIVDDEPLARQGVALRLRPHTDFEIIGECANGSEAHTAILALKPDIVFLDIQMPVLNGIDLVRLLPAEVRPFIIFLTAFDEYVMRAFEVHAIDYLLKPVDEARFLASLNHARRVLGNRSNGEYQHAIDNLFHSRDSLQPLHEITVRTGKKVRIIHVDEIDWIEAQGDYAKIYCGTSTHLLRESLNVLEGRLEAAAFLRIHRSATVRTKRIVNVSALPNRDCAVVLADGTQLRVSRTYSTQLRKLLRNQNL